MIFNQVTRQLLNFAPDKIKLTSNICNLYRLQTQAVSVIVKN